MIIIGISAYYHDSACALIKDGKIIAAAQEERFTRKKHDSRFPHYAMDYCLREAAIEYADVDYVVFYDKPFLKFERILETYIAFAPKGFRSFNKSMLVWLKDKLFLKKLLIRELSLHGFKKNNAKALLFSEHHVSHAASAFYPSPFNEAAILTMDGVGEWASTSIAVGSCNHIEMLKEIHFPHSLGLLYSAFTYYTGFKVNSGEYKLMGLAPYGTPRYVNQIKDHLIDIKNDGSFRLNMNYFDYCTGFSMTSDAFDKLFSGQARKDNETLTSYHADLAASIQAVTEEIVIQMTRDVSKTTGQKNLCLAGGVALNCVANGKVLRDGAFENIWVQPASGDAGGALGAALAAYYMHFDLPREKLHRTMDSMQGGYLGPAFSQDEIEKELRQLGAVFSCLDHGALLKKNVDDLVEGKAIALFHGRMEYGPRALGARSIIADPRSSKMQEQLNLKVKFRESFRPFAPAVLYEDVSDWFDISIASPYMLFCADVAASKRCFVPDEEPNLSIKEKLSIKRSVIPAVTHVDYSARIQTVHHDTNPWLHALISLFKEKTGCAVVVNTSFNVRGEPIVCTPADAFRCFMGTDIDALTIGNCYLEKGTQNSSLFSDYKNTFELD